MSTKAAYSTRALICGLASALMIATVQASLLIPSVGLKIPASLVEMGIRKSQIFEDWVVHEGFLSNAGIERLKLDKKMEGKRFAFALQEQKGGWTAVRYKVEGKDFVHFIRGPKNYTPGAQLRYSSTEDDGATHTMSLTVTPDGALPVMISLVEKHRLQFEDDVVTFSGLHGFKLNQFLEASVSGHGLR